MKQYYLLGALAVSVATSIAGAIYSVVSGNRIKELEYELDKKGEDVVKASEEKVRTLEKRLEQKVDGIANSLDIDVPDEIVEAALKKAADSYAKTSILAIERRVIDDYNATIRSEVRKSVELAYDNTKSDVKRELTKQVSNIDISGIKREIISDAKEKVEEELEDALKTMKDKFEEELEDAKDTATEKFEEELDSISTRFSNDLERGSKIYKVISDKLGTD